MFKTAAISLLLFQLAFIPTSPSSAQVRVTKSGADKSSLDMSNLKANSGSSALVRKVLESDLARSGWFTISRDGGEYRLAGTIDSDGSTIRATCQVSGGGRTVMSKSYNAKDEEARRLAHRIADDIIQAITGYKGICSGRLVLVSNRTGTKELYICDADGGGMVQLTQDRTISLYPSWSPNGETIYYTSYLKGFPDVYSIQLASGQRKRISQYPGLNAGARASPDGQDLALILSKDGTPELYIKNIGSGRLTRVTQQPNAAKASPSWSPNGQQLVYVSDQAGRPQIFIISRSGGQPRRISSRGNQNVSPDWGANGLIVYASQVGGSFQLTVYNPQTGDSKQVTDNDASYEEPCWAPDGRHIVCCRVQGRRSQIFLVDTLGDSPVPLITDRGDWYSPKWSSR